MDGKIEAVLALVPALHNLNKGKGNNSDQYPALKTRKRNAETWWDSLDWDKKVNVGNAALHFRKMSPSYPWRCQDIENDKGGSKFSQLTKSQQKIVKFVFEQRNKKYSMFDLAGLLKL